MSYQQGDALQEYLKTQELYNDPLYLILLASKMLIDAGCEKIELTKFHNGNYRIFLEIKEDVK